MTFGMKQSLTIIFTCPSPSHLSCSEDSCGFEHVFVGETKFGREIMGLHNWVQIYLQEKQNLLDYKGYKSKDNNVVLLSSINTKITQQIDCSVCRLC